MNMCVWAQTTIWRWIDSSVVVLEGLKLLADRLLDWTQNWSHEFLHFFMLEMCFTSTMYYILWLHCLIVDIPCMRTNVGKTGFSHYMHLLSGMNCNCIYLQSFIPLGDFKALLSDLLIICVTAFKICVFLPLYSLCSFKCSSGLSRKRDLNLKETMWLNKDYNNNNNIIIMIYIIAVWFQDGT